MFETLPTSPQEALTALEAGLPILCADGSRLWKSVDGQYHYDSQVSMSDASQLTALFRAVGKRVSGCDTLTSDDLFTLLIVIVLRDATVSPIESGGVGYIETTIEE